MKPNLSKKNCCRLEKHRYYELRHFAMQYRQWAQAATELSYNLHSGYISKAEKNGGDVKDPTPEAALQIAYYTDRMRMVEDACKVVNANVSLYIFRCLTEGESYDVMNAKHGIPCSRSTFYSYMRRCMYELHILRN